MRILSSFWYAFWVCEIYTCQLPPFAMPQQLAEQQKDFTRSVLLANTAKMFHEAGRCTKNWSRYAKIFHKTIITDGLRLFTHHLATQKSSNWNRGNLHVRPAEASSPSRYEDSYQSNTFLETQLFVVKNEPENNSNFIFISSLYIIYIYISAYVYDHYYCHYCYPNIIITNINHSVKYMYIFVDGGKLQYFTNLRHLEVRDIPYKVWGFSITYHQHHLKTNIYMAESVTYLSPVKRTRFITYTSWNKPNSWKNMKKSSLIRAVLDTYPSSQKEKGFHFRNLETSVDGTALKKSG